MSEEKKTIPKNKHHYLILGAGSIGQVIGAHLAQGGSKVTFFIKEEQRKLFENEGIQALNWAKRENCLLQHPRIITHEDEIKEEEIFAVFCCVRSEQIPSAIPILKSFPKDWPIVCFQPGFGDLEKLAKELEGRTLLHGHPGFFAYTEKPITNNYIHKFNPTLLSAYPPEYSLLLKPLIQSMVEDLLRGGLPAKPSSQVAKDRYFLYAYGICFLLGMKFHGWHVISLLRDSRLFGEIQEAAKEAVKVLQKSHQMEPPFWQKLWFKLPLGLHRLGLHFYFGAPDSYSFRMWTHHAPKIQQQTIRMANEIQTLAQKEKVAIPHFNKLVSLIDELNRNHEKRNKKENFSVITGKTA